MSEFLSEVNCHRRKQVKLYPGLIAIPVCTLTKPSGLTAPSPVFTCRSLADSSFEGFCFWCSNLGWQECNHAVCWLQLAGGLELIQMAVKCFCETEMAEQWIISSWRAQKLMQTVMLRRQAEEHEDIKQFLLPQASRDLYSSKFWESAASSLPPHLSWLISPRYRMFSVFFQNMWELQLPSNKTSSLLSWNA